MIGWNEQRSTNSLECFHEFFIVWAVDKQIFEIGESSLMNSLDVCNFFIYLFVLYYILFRERIKAVERHPEIGKSSAKYFNGNTLILPKRLTILDLNYGWFKFKLWLKIIGWTLNNFMDILSSALFFDHVPVVLVIAFFFQVIYFFHILFGLIYSFSFLTFLPFFYLNFYNISLFYLDFNFPFPIWIFFTFRLLATCDFAFFSLSTWTLEAVLSWIKRTKNVF